MSLLLAHSQEQSYRFLDMELRGDLQLIFLILAEVQYKFWIRV